MGGPGRKKGKLSYILRFKMLELAFPLLCPHGFSVKYTLGEKKMPQEFLLLASILGWLTLPLFTEKSGKWLRPGEGGPKKSTRM